MNKQDFLVLEYQTCHQKIAAAFEQLNRFELQIVLGISAIYAWLYATLRGDAPPAENIQLIIYLPTLLACLGWLRATMQIRYTTALAAYLRLIEERLSGPNGSDETEQSWPHIGWESWNNNKGAKRWSSAYRLLLWPGLIVGTLTIAFLEIGLHIPV